MSTHFKIFYLGRWLLHVYVLYLYIYLFSLFIFWGWGGCLREGVVKVRCVDKTHVKTVLIKIIVLLIFKKVWLQICSVISFWNHTFYDFVISFILSDKC